jgi:hypothetical protein
MEAVAEDGVLLEIAKSKAEKIVDSYDPSATFSLLTNDLDVSLQPFFESKQFVRRLHDLRVSPELLKASDLVAAARSRFGKGVRGSLFVISDFQSINSDWRKIEPDTLLDIYLIPLAAQAIENIGIDSVWFDKPSHLLADEEVLKVRVRNTSPDVVRDLPVTLRVNNDTRAVVNVSLEADESKVIDVVFTNKFVGTNAASISLDNYPVTFDNSFFFSFNVIDRIKVLVLNQQSEDRAFGALSRAATMLDLSQKSAASVAVSDLFDQDVVVLNQLNSVSGSMATQFNQFVANGGALAIVPPVERASLGKFTLLQDLSLPQFLSVDTTTTEVDLGVLNHKFFRNSIESWDKNTEMPFVSNKWMVDVSRFADWSQILWDKYRNPLLMQKTSAKGTLYLFSFSHADLYGKFAQNALFPVLWTNMFIESVKNEQLYYTIGIDQQLALKVGQTPSSETLKLLADDGSFSMAPTWFVNQQSRLLTLRLAGMIKTSGIYSLATDDVELSKLGINYNRNESQFSYQAMDDAFVTELQKQFHRVTIIDTTNPDLLVGVIKNSASGDNMWRFFLIFGIVFLVLETLILRFWK